MSIRPIAAAAFSVAAVTALATAALAADLPARGMAPAPYAPPVLVAPVSSWTGAYAGLVAGYAFWNQAPAKPNGAATGVRAGADYDLGNRVVIGGLVEGDLNTGSKSWAYSGGSGKIKHRDTLSVDARLGYAVDGTNLVYGLGGWTMADVPVSTTTAISVLHGTANGWNAGAGFEHKFAPNISGFAEYRYNEVRASGKGAFNEGKVGALYRF